MDNCAFIDIGLLKRFEKEAVCQAGAKPVKAKWLSGVTLTVLISLNTHNNICPDLTQKIITLLQL